MFQLDHDKYLHVPILVSQFGEDEKIDALIREYGYVGTPATLKSMKESKTLQENLSAGKKKTGPYKRHLCNSFLIRFTKFLLVAHLIHGSSEGRFQIKYCPGKLSKEEIEKVGFSYGDLDATMTEYNVQSLKDGWNTVSVGGIEEEIYFISNPALGLWAVQKRFDKSDHDVGDGPADNNVNVSLNQNASKDSGGIGGWKKAP